MFNFLQLLPELILLTPPTTPDTFPGKPELGQGLDEIESLLELEMMLFLVLIPIGEK